MSTPANNFKLGLFTLVGVIILIIALFFFGVRTYFEPTSLFETYFAGDVAGLSVGSTVELRGVRVGKVKSINFSWVEYEDTDPSYIVVVFEMRNDITPLPPGKASTEMLEQAIRRGLRARLKSQGVTGSSFLSLEYIDPVENPIARIPWTPNHTYVPSAPSQFGELLTSLQKALHSFQQLDLSNINQLVVYDLKSAGHVLDKAGQVDFNGISSNTTSLLAELRTSNVKLKTLLGDTDDAVNKMKLQKLSQDVDGLVGQLQTTVTDLQRNLANVDFDALNQTLENARRALQQMDEVLSQLKQYPSGFIFGSPPPAIKNVQPSTP
ncbi:MAG: MlaD family protein [Verrucomicrobiota bacterium]|jgi:ABC-type transporter Mla subunit MlaD